MEIRTVTKLYLLMAGQACLSLLDVEECLHINLQKKQPPKIDTVLIQCFHSACPFFFEVDEKPDFE